MLLMHWAYKNSKFAFWTTLWTTTLYLFIMSSLESPWATSIRDNWTFFAVCYYWGIWKYVEVGVFLVDKVTLSAYFKCNMTSPVPHVYMSVISPCHLCFVTSSRLLYALIKGDDDDDECCAWHCRTLTVKWQLWLLLYSQLEPTTSTWSHCVVKRSLNSFERPSVQYRKTSDNDCLKSASGKSDGDIIRRCDWNFLAWNTF